MWITAWARPRDLSNSLDSAYSDKYGPVVSDGQYIEIEHSQSYKTRFIYDESANEYKMQQNYSDGQWRDTVDEAADNKVLTFPNVIVLYTDIHTYPGHEAKDLQYVEYAWGGIGYYCYGGKCEKIYWQKGTPLEALRLYYLNEDGTCSDTPLEVNNRQELCGRDRRRFCRELCPQHAGRRQPVHRHDPDLREELCRGRRQGR